MVLTEARVITGSLVGNTGYRRGLKPLGALPGKPPGGGRINFIIFIKGLNLMDI
jgi:hypothetical protein